jgi:hypothetical protein
MAGAIIDWLSYIRIVPCATAFIKATSKKSAGLTANNF